MKTRSSVESDSVSSQTFDPGDTMWIVDDADRRIASVTVDARTRSIEIGSDCASFHVQ